MFQFTSGIDSTYDVYMFKFININPATGNGSFQVNFSSDSGSTIVDYKNYYHVFGAHHYENNGANAYLNYECRRGFVFNQLRIQNLGSI